MGSLGLKPRWNKIGYIFSLFACLSATFIISASVETLISCPCKQRTHYPIGRSVILWNFIKVDTARVENFIYALIECFFVSVFTYYIVALWINSSLVIILMFYFKSNDFYSICYLPFSVDLRRINKLLSSPHHSIPLFN